MAMGNNAKSLWGQAAPATDVQALRIRTVMDGTWQAALVRCMQARHVTG